MSNDKADSAVDVAEAPEAAVDPALVEFSDQVKGAQTVFLGIKFGKERDYLRVNKSDVIGVATKHGVPSKEVRGKFLFIHP